MPLVGKDNSILTIFPYCKNGIWMFDDKERGLHGEAFVSGADEIIERLTASIPKAHKGCVVQFSADPFPGYTLSLDKQETEGGGTWYFAKEYDLRGWLCPALFEFFQNAPTHIYVMAKALPKKSKKKTKKSKK